MSNSVIKASINECLRVSPEQEVSIYMMVHKLPNDENIGQGAEKK